MPKSDNPPEKKSAAKGIKRTAAGRFVAVASGKKNPPSVVKDPKKK